MRRKRSDLPDEILQRTYDFNREACNAISPLIEKYGVEISFNGMVDVFAVILMACCRNDGPEHVLDGVQIACETLIKTVEEFIKSEMGDEPVEDTSIV